MPVDMVFDSSQTYGGRAYRDCIASAHRHHVPLAIARRVMHWSSGDGVTLEILAPAMPFLADTGDDVNENSIVAMLHYGAFRELFMGLTLERLETEVESLRERLGEADQVTTWWIGFHDGYDLR